MSIRACVPFLLLACSETDLRGLDEDRVQIAVTPTSLDWGTVNEPTERSFRISNPGPLALEVERVVVEGEGFRLVHDVAGTVPFGGYLTATVVFEPPFRGTWEGTATVVSNAWRAEQVDVSLDAHTEVVPELVVTPDPVDFGTLFPGELSTQTVVIQNAGVPSLQITSVGTDNPDFRWNGPAVPFLVPGGSSLEVPIQVNPSATGEIVGNLSFGSNDPDGLLQVGLRAHGRDAHVTLDPPSLALGPMLAGATTEARVAVVNEGPDTARVRDVLVGGDGPFALAGALSLPFDLEPGERRELTIAVRGPLRDSAGTLRVSSSDPRGPAEAALTADVRETHVRITPDPLEFGATPAGPCERVLTVQNTGDAPLGIAGFEFTDPAFSASSAAIPGVIEPGASVRLAVAYASTPGVLATAAFVLDANVSAAESSSSVSGRGLAPERRSEAFRTDPDDPTHRGLDLILAFDRSGSMGGDRANIEALLPDLVDALNTDAPDWRIGVLGTSACFDGGYIEATDPGAEDALVAAALSGMGDGCPTPGCGTEALLGLAESALDLTGSGQCNAGFHDPDRMLQIIAFSDEPEQSGVDGATRATQLASHLADPNQLIISAVVDENHTCGAGPAGYAEAVAATDGILADVCAGDWPADLAASFGDLFERNPPAFLLQSLPDPASVQVQVDGVTWITGWYLDGDLVRFTVDPGPERSVSVSYQTLVPSICP